jgi:hypothetical protein
VGRLEELDTGAVKMRTQPLPPIQLGIDLQDCFRLSFLFLSIAFTSALSLSGNARDISGKF